MTTDVSNYGTLATNSIETNTIKAGTDNGLASSGDLILQANNQPSDSNVVFSTFHYDTIPTLTFSVQTQIKTVKDPSATQDVATKNYVDSVELSDLPDTEFISLANNDALVYQLVPNKWVNMPYRMSFLQDVNLAGLANDKILKYDNSTSKWIIADAAAGGAVSILQFDMGYNTSTNDGTAVTIGGNNGVFTNLWDTITAAGPTVNTDFSFDTSTGVLTYTSTATVKVLINAHGMLGAGSNDSTVIKTRLLKNTGGLRFLSARISKESAGGTPFDMTVTTSLSQNDTISYVANNPIIGSNTYTINVHGLQMCIYGVN